MSQPAQSHQDAVGKTEQSIKEQQVEQYSLLNSVSSLQEHKETQDMLTTAQPEEMQAAQQQDPVPGKIFNYLMRRDLLHKHCKVCSQEVGRGQDD